MAGRVLLVLCVAYIGGARADNYDFNSVEAGKSYQFKVELRAGTQECFYETFRTNASLYSAFQVISTGLGGEYAASLTVRRLPGYEVVFDSPWEGHAYVNLDHVESGTYEFCLNNGPSYTRKVVFLYIEFHERVDWQKSIKDEGDGTGDLQHDALSASLHSIQLSIEKMLFHQSLYEQRSSYQEHVIYDLSQIVHVASIALCLAVVASGMSQAFYLKHLFKSKTAKGPPRA